MKFKLPDSVLKGVTSELLALRPSDVITKSRLASKGNLDIKSAERILVELVNDGILDMIFAVECKGDDGERHTVLFENVEDLSEAFKKKCPSCEADMDFDNIRVGFKRKNK